MICESSGIGVMHPDFKVTFVPEADVRTALINLDTAHNIRESANSTWGITPYFETDAQ